MQFSPLLENLIESLRCLPGVGRKSAQRAAFYLLERDREGGQQLAHALTAAFEQIGHCDTCRIFTEQVRCPLCQSAKRHESGLLCVVESPADVLAIEQSAQFNGRYFVLYGHLSPLDGIGPDELGLDALEQQLAAGDIKEMILATNTTVEGEATAHYLAQLGRQHQIIVSRIAHGVPVGGELEYVDGNTLGHSFTGRTPLE